MPRKHSNEFLSTIRRLASEGFSSTEISLKVGISPKAVQKLYIYYDIPCLNPGPRHGDKNPSWKGGRMIDKDGYVLVRATSHPNVNACGYVREHRLVMELHLDRYLTREEVVDHIDGDKQNNSLENLRVFARNADHLRETLKGKCPKWSEDGRRRTLEGIRRTKGRPRPRTPTA